MMQLSPSSSTTSRRVPLITVTENEQRTVLAELKARGVVVEENSASTGRAIHWHGGMARRAAWRAIWCGKTNNALPMRQAV